MGICIHCVNNVRTRTAKIKKIKKILHVLKRENAQAEVNRESKGACFKTVHSKQ